MPFEFEHGFSVCEGPRATLLVNCRYQLSRPQVECERATRRTNRSSFAPSLVAPFGGALGARSWARSYLLLKLRAGTCVGLCGVATAVPGARSLPMEPR